MLRVRYAPKHLFNFSGFYLCMVMDSFIPSYLPTVPWLVSIHFNSFVSVFCVIFFAERSHRDVTEGSKQRKKSFSCDFSFSYTIIASYAQTNKHIFLTKNLYLRHYSRNNNNKRKTKTTTKLSLIHI